MVANESKVDKTMFVLSSDNTCVINRYIILRILLVNSHLNKINVWHV